jgi:hypothetical protein
MRIIYVIAAFALATVVCADVTTSNDASSLQMRSLRAEVHEARIRRPVDGSISSDYESTSAQAPATTSGDQAPPSRKRKSMPTDVQAGSLVKLKNAEGVTTGGGAASSKNIPIDVIYASGVLVNLKNAGTMTNSGGVASSTGTWKQNGLNLNDANAGEIADAPGTPRKASRSEGMSSPMTTGDSPARPLNMNGQVFVQGAPRMATIKSTDKERKEIVLFLRHRMKHGSLAYGAIKEAAQHFGRHRDTIARIWHPFDPNAFLGSH